ncbi:MAG: heme-binding protein [Acidimicrobiales bacterium]
MDSPISVDVPRLTLAGAQQLVAAALDEAQTIGVRVVIHVCDPAGDPLALARMDGSPKFSITIAAKKAWSAAAAGAPTAALAAAFADNPTLLHGVAGKVDDLIAVGGGVPVLIDGSVAGAIGVSGATEEQDHQIAATAAAAVAR